ncbi:MAG: hypothetical protein WCC26_21510 [Terracidiphilus sp.]
MQQTSRGKFDRLQRTTAGFTDTRLDGYGLCCSLPTRPRVLLASYPILVHRHTPLLHASFRPRLATTPLRFANPSPPIPAIRARSIAMVSWPKKPSETQFQSSEKVLGSRGSAVMNLEASQAIEQATRKGRGEIWLELTKK